ncbi:hypothetical protein [Streptomyces sp. NPDC004658]|uniref:hypothetical protein n=1 Tax=unclassified Streptomyces TaxID=2593676 RepID=UPI0033B7D1ED
MGRKKPVAEESEEQPEGSPVAGACVLVVLGGAVLAVVYAVSPDAGIGAVWVVGIVAMWRVAKSVRGAANPAPPGSPAPLPDTKPQFTIVEDREGHCTVTWSTSTGD